jgi:hypothetical protein
MKAAYANAIRKDCYTVTYSGKKTKDEGLSYAELRGLAKSGWTVYVSHDKYLHAAHTIPAGCF